MQTYKMTQIIHQMFEIFSRFKVIGIVNILGFVFKVFDVKFLAKVAQIFREFLGYSVKHHCQVKFPWATL